MKMKDAQKIINGKRPGFRVHFAKITGNLIETGYFPGKKEPLIKTEDEAWIQAEKFAENTVGEYVDIYVVDENYAPVSKHELNKVDNRDNKKPANLG